MAQLFGSGDNKTLKKEVSTALILGIIFTISLSIICIILSRWILIITRTPKEILNDTDIFLKIIFGGMIFSFFYNYYSSALRAIGDSKTPLIFLIVSFLLNAVLCVIFIIKFRLGVAGSAIATVVAQGVSSVLCILYIYFKIPLLKLKRNELIIDKSPVKMTIQYSWVTALQQTCLYIGKLLIQGVVNAFGINAIAAYNSVTRVDSFMLAPGDSFSSSIAIYSAQNKGGEKFDRIIDGYKKGNLIIAIYGITTSLIIFLEANRIMKLFVSGSERDVILIGVNYLKLMYLLCTFRML